MIDVGGHLGFFLALLGVAACIWAYRRNR